MSRFFALVVTEHDSFHGLSRQSAQAFIDLSALIIVRNKMRNGQDGGRTMLTDADLAGLAAAGGRSLVGAMATDAWQVARNGMARLFGRCGAQRRAAVEAQLDANVALVERASEPDQARQRLAPVWELELALLLKGDPESEAELRQLIAHLCDALPLGKQLWVQTNVAHGGSRVFAVQGGNIVYHEATAAVSGHQKPLPQPGLAEADPGSEQ
jgi:hypothetical protein